MRSLLFVALLAAAPPDRAAIFALMAQQPLPGCATGNPWTTFVFEPHDAATNRLLMELTHDRSVTEDQRRYALDALATQEAPEVVAFMRTWLRDAPPLSPARRTAARALAEHGASADLDLVVAAFEGDVELTAAVLVSIGQHSELRPSPRAVAAVRALWKASDDARVREFGARWLVRVDPKGGAAAEGLASKDPRVVSAVLKELTPELADPQALIAALADAPRSDREQGETLLAQHLTGLLARSRAAPLAEQLATEWLSKQRRPGLARAPAVAYVLGTWAEDRGTLDRAEQLYRAGREGVAALGLPDDQDLAGVDLALRAQLANLLMKRKRLDEARTLAAGLGDQLRANGRGQVVLDNYAVGSAGVRGGAYRLEETLAKKSK